MARGHKYVYVVLSRNTIRCQLIKFTNVLTIRLELEYEAVSHTENYVSVESSVSTFELVPGELNISNNDCIRARWI